MMQQSTRAGDGFASSITQALAVSNTTVEACRVLVSHPFGKGHFRVSKFLKGTKASHESGDLFLTGPSECGQSAGVSAQPKKRGFRGRSLEASSLN